MYTTSQDNVGSSEVNWRVTVQDTKKILVSFEVFEIEPSAYFPGECYATFLVHYPFIMNKNAKEYLTLLTDI
jgi:hypothetical protein